MFLDERQRMLYEMMGEGYPSIPEEPEAQYSEVSEEMLRLSKEVGALTGEVRRLSAEVNRQCNMNRQLMGELSRHFASDEQVLKGIKTALEALKR